MDTLEINSICEMHNFYMLPFFFRMKVCYEMEKQNLVVPKMCSSNDSSWLRFAKYALELWCFKNILSKELKRMGLTVYSLCIKDYSTLNSQQQQ